jgi:argininosuccinate lyase
MYSVEVVNNMVLEGMPFRDAYKKVGGMIEDKTFTALDTINHTHEGSIGNLMHAEIKSSMQKTLNAFEFNKVDRAIQALLKPM